MSLLNRHYPLLHTYDTPTITYIDGIMGPSSGLVGLKKFIDNNDIWYCSFSTPRCFLYFNIKDLMIAEHYQKVLAKEAYIVLDLSFEPFLDTIDSIYINVILAHNIPPSQVIFINNMYDADDYNRKAAVRHNSDPMRIFYFSALEWHVANHASVVNSKPLEIKEYTKKYLNLNRRWRMHRPILTMLLYHKKLLDKGHVSFGPCEDHSTWDEVWLLLESMTAATPKLREAFRDSQDIKNMPWMYLDTSELHTNRAVIEASIDKFYYDSYFSVISETTFYTNEFTNSRFITEKTFKSILMRHPFVIVSVPNSLVVLKQLGYKTFAPWINESYDCVLNDNDRMLAIADEIERLVNLKKEELEEFLRNVISICEYNYQLLCSRTNFIYEDVKNGD